MPHQAIAEWPYVLRTDKFGEFNKRHKFLKMLNKAQYDPDLPDYVPIMALTDLNPDAFCKYYAKVIRKKFSLYEKALDEAKDKVMRKEMTSKSASFEDKW